MLHDEGKEERGKKKGKGRFGREQVAPTSRGRIVGVGTRSQLAFTRQSRCRERTSWEERKLPRISR